MLASWVHAKARSHLGELSHSTTPEPPRLVQAPCPPELAGTLALCPYRNLQIRS